MNSPNSGPASLQVGLMLVCGLILLFLAISAADYDLEPHSNRKDAPPGDRRRRRPLSALFACRGGAKDEKRRARDTDS